MQAASSPGRPILRNTLPTENRDDNALLVAERDGPEMLARIAVMKALNRHQGNADAGTSAETGEGFGLFGENTVPAHMRPVGCRSRRPPGSAWPHVPVHMSDRTAPLPQADLGLGRRTDPNQTSLRSGCRRFLACLRATAATNASRRYRQQSSGQHPNHQTA
jgi:hypothetical protein